MVYVISDIHGCYDQYVKLLEKIKFQHSDTLFVLGDIVDRREQPIKVLKDMMYRSNVIPILGNHEYMAMELLKILRTEITEESISKLNDGLMRGLSDWLANGGQTTINEFCKLSKESQEDILAYLGDFSLYEEITVKGQDYILVHAGLLNFSEERSLEDYKLHELIFESPDYSKVYFCDKILVTGHTPVCYIHGKDRIYRKNNHLAIDCGACFGGNLAAVCLDTGEEFYV